MTTDPDPLLLGEWFARYRMRMKFGKPNQVEAYDKLRAILGMEADDEDVYHKAVQYMERVALSKKVEGFVITPAHVEHLFTVQPGQTKAAISEEDYMANFCTPVFWDSKVPEDMLPVMKRLCMATRLDWMLTTRMGTGTASQPITSTCTLPGW